MQKNGWKQISIRLSDFGCISISALSVMNKSWTSVARMQHNIHYLENGLAGNRNEITQRGSWTRQPFHLQSQSLHSEWINQCKWARACIETKSAKSLAPTAGSWLWILDFIFFLCLYRFCHRGKWIFNLSEKKCISAGDCWKKKNVSLAVMDTRMSIAFLAHIYISFKPSHAEFNNPYFNMAKMKYKTESDDKHLAINKIQSSARAIALSFGIGRKLQQNLKWIVFVIHLFVYVNIYQKIIFILLHCYRSSNVQREQYGQVSSRIRKNSRKRLHFTLRL